MTRVLFDLFSAFIDKKGIYLDIPTIVTKFIEHF